MTNMTVKTAAQVIGILQSLTSIFQFGDRTTLLKITTPSLYIIDLIKEDSTGDYQLRNKLIMKLSQRIGMSFLPPRIPKWMYLKIYLQI